MKLNLELRSSRIPIRDIDDLDDGRSLVEEREDVNTPPQERQARSPLQVNLV